MIDLNSYETIIVAFSGGKDSMACLLHLLDMGADKSRIELWHHDIDGQEGSDLMDWAPTRAYCRAVGKAFGIPVYLSWLIGGFEREMLKENQRKAATVWENPDGTIGQAGGIRGKLSTRRKFPQVSSNLSVRWCSAYLKIDVCATAIRNQSRFGNGSRTLVVTGERAEESAARANYKIFEPDRADSRGAKSWEKQRHIDHWRPVHSWGEKEVWEIFKRHRVRPHPAYEAGFGRVSCQFCIFGSANQWASAQLISPERFEVIADYEEDFGLTIQRNENIRHRAGRGTPYVMSEEEMTACKSKTYERSIFLAPDETWEHPKGAFGESCGPT